MLLVLGTSTRLLAQTEPDTVRRKPTLPTGPTPTQRQQQQQPLPPPRVIEMPPVQEQPPVVEKQEDEFKEKVPLMHRLYWGGGFGLQFGTYTAVSLSPLVGYRVTEKFWLGGGVTYQYQGGEGISLQNVGGKVYAQQEVYRNFLVHAEYEVLSVEYLTSYYNGYYEKDREVMSLPMAGLGYRQFLSNKVSSDILVLYNFNDEFPNPYSNPVIRVNFNFAFVGR
ncbi:outer membrane protein transport protein [Pontibacter ruber]|uniref:Outer membrane protein transport protein n=1 Tax=Pontibacter ruber TaxID=1343895 RepID=A0ABW5CSP6_9BACT|nr:outer membrane protein transport protein [Pontibacter ruber]